MLKFNLTLSLTFCSLLIVCEGQAKRSFPGDLQKAEEYFTKKLEGKNINITAKTTSSGRRLKAESKYVSDGSTLVFSDTFTNQYSAGRTKTNDDKWAFDSQIGKSINPSNTAVSVKQFYDANNNRIGFELETSEATSGAWRSGGWGKYSYNTANFMLSSSGYYKNGSLEKYDSSSNIYDADNSLLQSSQAFAGSAKTWNIRPRKIYQYDATAKKNLIQIRGQKWDGTSSIWVDTTKQINTFDAAGFLSGTLFQEKVAGSSIWENISKVSFINNTLGDADTVITEVWDKVSASYLPSKKQFNIFSGHNLLRKREDEWNNKTSVFDSVLVELYTYDASNRKVSGSFEKFNFGGTLASYPVNGKDIFTYDAADNITQLIHQDLDKSHTWQNTSRNRYTFDANGDMVKLEYDTWEAASASWIFAKDNYVSYYYYEDASAITGFIKDETRFSIYPNPSNGALTVTTIIDAKEAVKANVYDMLGHKVYEQDLVFSNKKSSLNLGVSNGFYFIKLIDANGNVLCEKVEIRK